MELKHFVEVGTGFYNLKTPFVMYGFIDIGTQMSLLRLKSTGKFLVIDTCGMHPAAKAEFDHLTSNGTLIDAVIATHPFHTIYFEAFHAMYPLLKYYGTPRHIRTIPSIKWAGDVSTEAVRSLWASEVDMRIPDGAEFVDPADNDHFSSVFVFHKESKTIHDDDTLMYFDSKHVGCCLGLMGLKAQQMNFHPTLNTTGIKDKASMTAFKEWLRKIMADWDFENVCTAHYGVLRGGAKQKLADAMTAYEKKNKM